MYAWTDFKVTWMCPSQSFALVHGAGSCHAHVCESVRMWINVCMNWLQGHLDVPLAVFRTSTWRWELPCICAWVCACVDACMDGCMHVCMYVWSDYQVTWMCPLHSSHLYSSALRATIHMCICLGTHVCMYAVYHSHMSNCHLNACMYVSRECMYVCMYKCICLFTYVCIHTCASVSV